MTTLQNKSPSSIPAQTTPHSTASHTPGPWHHYRHSTTGIPVVGTTRASEVQHAVAHICPTGRTAVDEANARLIAAAPELLEALTTAEHAFHLLAANIAMHMPGSPLIQWAKSAEEDARAAIAKATQAQ